MFYAVVHRGRQSIVAPFEQELQALHHLNLACRPGESVGLGYVERSTGKVRLTDPYGRMPESFNKQALRTWVLSAHFLSANWVD